MKKKKKYKSFICLFLSAKKKCFSLSSRVYSNEIMPYLPTNLYYEVALATVFKNNTTFYFQIMKKISFWDSLFPHL